MKNRKIYYILIVLIIASCNKWLDISPRTEVKDEEIFTNETGFYDAIMSCYLKMNGRTLYGENLTMTSIEYLAQHWDLDVNNQKNERLISDFKYKSDYPKGVIKSIYSSLYNVIAQANLVLKNIDLQAKNVLSEESMKHIKAEALAIRGNCHFEVLRLFGQLPQNANTKVLLPYAELLTKEKIPYYTYNHFVDKILNDLNTSEDLLKEIGDDDNFKKYGTKFNSDNNHLSYRRYRINYYSVKALKARLFLYIGNNTKAYEFAKNVIDSSGVKLSGDTDLDANRYSLPEEFIFALSKRNLYDQTDKLFKEELNISSNKLKNGIFKGRSIASNNRYNKVWGTVTTETGSEKPYLKKFTRPEGLKKTPSFTLNTVVPIIRLSEMYLIVMEASDNINEINKLYTQYMLERNEQVKGFSSLNEVKSEIINEYRREFFGEGYMFYVYKRLGAKSMLWKNDREISENDYIIPLPDSEIKK